MTESTESTNNILFFFILTRHFDWTFWRDILMRHFDETFWWDILTRHLKETLWRDILRRQFDKIFWWDILIDILTRHIARTFWQEIWGDTLTKYFDKTFWRDILTGLQVSIIGVGLTKPLNTSLNPTHDAFDRASCKATLGSLFTQVAWLQGYDLR